MITDLIWAIVCLIINFIWYIGYKTMNQEWHATCSEIVEMLISGQAERTELADELVKEADHGTD